MQIFNKKSKGSTTSAFDATLLLDLYRLKAVFNQLKTNGIVTSMKISHAANLLYPLSTAPLTRVNFFASVHPVMQMVVDARTDSIDLYFASPEIEGAICAEVMACKDICAALIGGHSETEKVMIECGMARIGVAARFNMVMQAIGNPGRLCFMDEGIRKTPNLAHLYGTSILYEFDDEFIMNMGMRQLAEAAQDLSIASLARDRAMASRLLMTGSHDLTSPDFRILADLDCSDLAIMSQLRGAGLDRAAAYGQNRMRLLTDIRMAGENAVQNETIVSLPEMIEKPLFISKEVNPINSKHWVSWNGDHAMCIITAHSGQFLSMSVAEHLPMSGLIAIDEFLRGCQL